jgi:hypothetical protein
LLILGRVTLLFSLQRRDEIIVILAIHVLPTINHMHVARFLCSKKNAGFIPMKARHPGILLALIALLQVKEKSSLENGRMT